MGPKIGRKARAMEKRSVSDQLQQHSIDGTLRFLESRPNDGDPVLTNIIATMGAVLALSDGFAQLLRQTMPHSLDRVSSEVLAIDSVAYITCTLQQASYVHYQRNRLDRTSERAWLQLVSVLKTIKEVCVDKCDPALGAALLERWTEFRSTEMVHDRFHALAYLLFTSKGNAAPMRRYPESPPVILDLDFSLEAAFAELPCGQYVLDAAETFRRVVARMPEDEDHGG